MSKHDLRITGPGAGPQSDPHGGLDAKRRMAFELVSLHQRQQRAAFENAPSHLQDIVRFGGLLERRLVTWDEARRWPEGHCDELIRHYSPERRRYVW